MEYFERLSKRKLDLPENLHLYIDNTNADNIGEVLDALETSVSNGWIGEASAIADALNSSAIIDEKPEWRICLEIEKMKKYHYFGRNSRAREASRRVLSYLKEKQNDISLKKYCEWQFTAIGQMAWIDNERDQLEQTIFECNDSLEKSKIFDDLHVVLYAFHTAMNGRLQFIDGNKQSAKQKFEKALSFVSAPSTIRPYAHIIINYAENLNLVGLEEEAVAITREFLKKENAQLFKTHLLIRAYIILLNSKSISERDRRDYTFQFQNLMFAMGLAQASNLYPLINKAKSLIPEKDIIDFYNLNLRPLLEERIKALISIKDYNTRGLAFERLIKKYLEDIGYSQVIGFSLQFPAFDLIASKWDETQRKNVTTVVQVKCNSIDQIGKGTIPTSKVIADAKTEIESKYSVKLYNVEWYLYSGMSKAAENELEFNLKTAFGSADLRIISTTEELINFYIGEPKKLFDLLSSNVWYG